MSARSDRSFRQPPYFPGESGAPEGRGYVKVASSSLAALLVPFGGQPGAELGALVAVLRAALLVHQSHHWQTRGPSFFGDHQLFEKLYADSLGPIDQVAERAVGSGSRNVVNAGILAAVVAQIVAGWCGQVSDPSSAELAALSLGVERSVVNCVTAVKAALEARGALSEGTDNLLQGVADKHEEFVYLLQQRVADGYSYDAR